MTLAFATIFSLVSVTLLAISFSTDNWMKIKVDRDHIRSLREFAGLDEVDESPLYFTRTRGLFRECFPGEKTEDPETSAAPIGDKYIDLYMSPVDTYCRNLDYYIPEEGRTKNLKADDMARIHMARAMIAMFIVSFFFVFVSFTAGVRGCWKTSPTDITASAVLMLIACLFAAAGMGLWHGVEHWEMNKIKTDTHTELFVNSWPEALKEATEFSYDWSYIVAWIGVGMSLLSAILFSLAAVCIRTDKEREEAMNMQYLMPVYHQKQQQQQQAAAYGGGPYGYAAYPGPYYGSQYGPY